jgi:hypothetical protein
MPTNFGWTYSATRIDDAKGRIAAAGFQFSYAADRPSMLGYWKRRQAAGIHWIAAQDDEMKLNGKWRDPNNQARGTCHPAGVMILMADKTEKPIQEVVIGDRVLSHTDESRRVSDIGVRKYSGDLLSFDAVESGRCCIVTPDHLIAHFPGLAGAWLRPEFAPAYKIETGNRIGTLTANKSESNLSRSFDRVKMASFARVTGCSVHSIEVEADHTYYANGMLVHNCVGQGSSRAIEDVINSRIVDGEIMGESQLVAFEPMYGFERNTRWQKTHPFGCRCGNCPDGLAGADAAAFYSQHGYLKRDVYGSIDLSQPQEHFAIDWNNSGVPGDVLNASTGHQVQCHSSDSWDEYADAIASKDWGHICLPKVFGYSRVIVGPYGTVEPDTDAGHDTECVGCCTLPSNETAFLIQNSWGLGVKYPPSIQVLNGNGATVSKQMRPGSYAVRQSVLEGLGNAAERISCDIQGSSVFR